MEYVIVVYKMDIFLFSIWRNVVAPGANMRSSSVLRWEKKVRRKVNCLIPVVQIVDTCSGSEMVKQAVNQVQITLFQIIM